MKVRFSFMLSLMALMALTISCSHSNNPDTTPTDPSISLVDSVYFDTDIQPLIIANCAYSGCHDSESKREGVDLSSYSKIISTGEVKAGEPERSEFYEVLIKSGEEAMPPSNPLSNEQIGLVYAWIKQGALNNVNPNLGCDTSNVTYSGKVSSIISSYCTSCHNASSLSGGFALETYEQVKAKADNGSLYGSISGNANYATMPPGGSLSDCDIASIRIWIENGAANN